MSKEFKKMQKLAGLITENQVNESPAIPNPTERAWKLWLKLSEEEEIEDYDINGWNHFQIGEFLRELQWIENNKDKYTDEELSKKFSEYLDEVYRTGINSTDFSTDSSS